MKNDSEKAHKTLKNSTLLIVARYPAVFSPLAFLSMGIFHLPLMLNKKINFYKLMGCGKNRTFDLNPDLRQWAIMVFFQFDDEKDISLESIQNQILGSFIMTWWKICRVKKTVFVLEPVAGHGTWDGKEFIAPYQKQTETAGKIAVLTRATIRLSKLRQFWGAVPAAAMDLSGSKGFLYSIGIGEIPFVKQATFSIWNSVEEMKQYAYGRKEHQEVIKRTRKEDWYSEEMFLRFRVLKDNLPGTPSSSSPQNNNDQ